MPTPVVLAPVVSAPDLPAQSVPVVDPRVIGCFPIRRTATVCVTHGVDTAKHSVSESNAINGT